MYTTWPNVCGLVYYITYCSVGQEVAGHMHDLVTLRHKLLTCKLSPMRQKQNGIHCRLLAADLRYGCQRVGCVTWKLSTDGAITRKADRWRQTGTLHTWWWIDLLIPWLLSLQLGSVQFSGCFIVKVQRCDPLPKKETKWFLSCRAVAKLKQLLWPLLVLHSVLLSVSVKVQHSCFTAELHNYSETTLMKPLKTIGDCWIVFEKISQL